MAYKEIRYTASDKVACITLNRPDRLNAWTPRMAEEMAHAFRTANDDPEVAVIVLTGEGRGFCAGADMEDTFKSRLDGTDPGTNTAAREMLLRLGGGRRGAGPDRGGALRAECLLGDLNPAFRPLPHRLVAARVQGTGLAYHVVGRCRTQARSAGVPLMLTRSRTGRTK